MAELVQAQQQIKKDPRGGYRPGAGRPPGSRNRQRRAAKSNDAAVLSTIENRLREHAVGKCEMSPTQVMAARAVYDKLRPTLAAVEHTQQDPRDKIAPEELLARLVAVFDAKPELLAQVTAALARRSAANDAIPSEPLKQLALSA